MLFNPAVLQNDSKREQDEMKKLEGSVQSTLYGVARSISDR